MVKIDRSMVMNNAKWKSPGTNHKTVIVLHETANTSRGAGAYAHHRLQANGNPREASWHYTVENDIAVQSYNENLRLWHSGSTAIPYAIAIEMCVNSDSNYQQTIQSTIDLCVDIAKRNNITTNNLVTHMFYTGKNCPTRLLSGRYGWTFSQVVNAVEQKLQGNSKAVANPPKQPKKSSKSIKTLAQEVINGKYGSGADRMKALGHQYEAVQNEVNKQLLGTPKPTNKKKSPTIDQLVKETLAGVHGNGEERKRKLGKNYQAVQNRINKGQTNATSKSNKSIQQMADEVNRGLHGQGHSNRQKSLGVNNATYQKVRNRVNQMYQ